MSGQRCACGLVVVCGVVAVLLSSCLVGTRAGGQSGVFWSGGEFGGQSGVVRMSGGYVVNEDGSLQRPRVDVRLPELGAVAFQFNEIGAKYAARYYLDLVEYAWATGDTAPMRNFATDECTPCTSMADAVDELYASGGWDIGASYKVVQVTRVEQLAGSASIYGTEMIIKNGKHDSYSEGNLTTYPEKTEHIVFFSNWDGEQWKIAEVGALDNE